MQAMIDGEINKSPEQVEQGCIYNLSYSTVRRQSSRHPVTNKMKSQQNRLWLHYLKIYFCGDEIQKIVGSKR